MWLKQGYEKVSVFFFAVISVCMMAGCVVHSVRPFHEKESVADMPDLYGKWILKESRVEEGLNREWVFAADKIVVPEFKGTPATLSTRFFKIDDMLFLDAVADASPDCLSFWWVLHITPVHTVSRVVADGKTMKIIPLNASWMEDAVKTGEVTLPSVWHQEQQSNLFTASTAEWGAFLKKYGKDQQAFPEKDAFVFARL